MLLEAFVSALLLASPPDHEASGRVLGEDGTPVVGAEVCEFVNGEKTGRCISTDEQGLYRIAKTPHPRLVVRAKGFVATTVDAAPLASPVTLRRAASLLVTVVDSETQKPVPAGRVRLDTSTGKHIGDVMPFNRSGVRISTLDPGVVFVRAEADGYLKAGPTPVELAGGSERTVTISMKKVGAKAR